MNAATGELAREVACMVKQHLAGDYSRCLTKYSYLGGGCADYLDLIQRADYFGHRRELVLLRRMAPHLIRQPDLGIIDLGPGNGQKAVVLLENSHAQFRGYVAFDLSAPLLERAAQTQRHCTITRKYTILDFHRQDLLERELQTMGNAARLFLLLGNTLANETDMKRYLQNLRRTVQSTASGRDYLIMGVECLSADPSSILAEYRNAENYRLTFRPLELLSIDRQQGVIDIRFNRHERRIEEWFIFRERERLMLQGGAVAEKGSRILLSVTYKPRLQDLVAMVSSAGWNVDVSMAEENQAMLLLSLHAPIKDNRFRKL